jgi:hypothetical protein
MPAALSAQCGSSTWSAALVCWALPNMTPGLGRTAARGPPHTNEQHLVWVERQLAAQQQVEQHTE